MKTIPRIPFLLLVAAMLILLAGCGPAINTSDGLIVGNSYDLASGQTINHDLTVVGGNVNLEQGSTVNGSVAVLGGNVTIDGRINGDVTTIGGSVSLNDHADILGQLNTVGGSLRRSGGAIVQGETLNNNKGFTPLPAVRSPLTQVSVDPITGPLMAIFQALALAALAIVVNLFAPRLMERTGQTAQGAPLASGGVGCLTLIVLVVMAITIILIPISLLGLLIAGIAALFGWLALGLLVGRRLAVWMNQPWSDPINAGVGTLSISLLASLFNIIPCIGWIVAALIGLVALGAVVLSRFGTQIYTSQTSFTTGSHPGLYAPPPASPYSGTHTYGPESDQPGGSQPPNQEGPQL